MNINNWAPSHMRMNGFNKGAVELGVRNMMLREGSVLRVIGMGSIVHRVRRSSARKHPFCRNVVDAHSQGQWVAKKNKDGTARVDFEITSNEVQDMWD